MHFSRWDTLSFLYSLHEYLKRFTKEQNKSISLLSIRRLMHVWDHYWVQLISTRCSPISKMLRVMKKAILIMKSVMKKVDLVRIRPISHRFLILFQFQMHQSQKNLKQILNEMEVHMIETLYSFLILNKNTNNLQRETDDNNFIYYNFIHLIKKLFFIIIWIS